jgi:DNA-binding protein HU-beta
MMEEKGGGSFMFKREVIRSISRLTRLPQDIVDDVIKATHKVIQEELRGGRSVTFSGWGTYYARRQQGGKVRHVTTGKMVEYAARKVAAFKPGSDLKKAVRGK